MGKDFPPEFMALLESVRGKRSRVVVEHILKHGYITTEELQREYGYEHPPRAIRDVREQGVPIETFKAENSEGKRIAAYRFGRFTEVRNNRLMGRIVLPKKLKETLIQQDGSKCAICLSDYEDRYLQIDHRVPYEVAGDQYEQKPNSKDFLLLCNSCNRAKSWSCEQCPNWIDERNIKICQACYWASPEDYKHIALKEVRRLELVWLGEEVETFYKLKAQAEKHQKEVPDYVKAILDIHSNNNS